MCPPPSRWGRKARHPCTTPQKLTPITHSQALSGPNQASPRGATPALLHTTCTPPKRSTASAASACTSASLLTSVRTVCTSDAVRADLGGGRGEGVLLDVGEHDVQAGGGEPLRQCQPDPAAASGDHRDLTPGELHGPGP